MLDESGHSPLESPEVERERQLDALTVEMLKSIEHAEFDRVEELKKQHPDFSVEIAAFLEGQRLLKEAEDRAGVSAHRIEVTSQNFPRPFGDYELLEEIARGGMGVVYRARENQLGRDVALKILTLAHLASPTDLARFKLGAEAAALLHHPNIVPIYSIGWQDGQPFFTMPLVDGSTLARHVQAFVGKPRQAASLMEKLARAVHHAHERGVLHRDLKPANILIDSAGEPHVTDFGLARILARNERVTVTGSILGTSSYVAPELLSGKPGALTMACDVYSLSIVLYELLCGSPPFKDLSPLREFRRACEDEARFPHAAVLTSATDLRTICLKGLSKDPRQRYKSALDLAEDLRRYLDGKPIRARPASGFERAAKLAKRKPGITLLLGGVLVLVSLYMALWLQHAGVTIRHDDALLKVTSDLEARKRSNQRLLYGLKLSLAGASDEKLEVRQARRLLQDLMPLPGEPDLRGFEWHLLFRLCHAADSGERISVWSSTNLASPQSLNVPASPGTEPGAIVDVRFSQDGKRLVTVGNDFDIRVLSMVQGRLGLEATPRHHLSWPQGPHRVGSLSPDARWAAAGSGPSGVTVTVWKLAQALPPEVAVTTDGLGIGVHQQGVSAVAFSDDSRCLATAGAEGNVKIWRLVGRPECEEWREKMSIDTKKETTLLKFAPDGKTLAAGTSLKDRRTALWLDLATGYPRATLHCGEDGVTAMAFSPDSSVLVTGSLLGELAVWHLREASRGTTLEARQLESPRSLLGPIRALTFTPDGRRLASGCECGEVKLWDFMDGDTPFELLECLNLRAQKGGVLALGFSPDGQTLVSGGISEERTRGEIKLWQAATPVEVRR